MVIRGAREHNLRNVDVAIPKKQLVVLTGVSGSGKSSLAFDTLYAEGQRRYVESLSTYARQFLDRLDKPRYDTIVGLAPTIAIEQRTAGNNPRSTVGTITEILDYLRVLFARIGEQSCHLCGRGVAGQSAEQIAHDLILRAARTEGGSREPVMLLARLLDNRKGEQRELLEDARHAGHVRLRIDGEIVRSEEVLALDKRKKHTVDVVVDRVHCTKGELSRLTESVERALLEGAGVIRAASRGEPDRIYSQKMACASCEISFPEPSPQSFSFNSPQGMCEGCNGLGSRVEIDVTRVVADESLSLDEGAVVPWGKDVSEKRGWAHDFRGQIVELLEIDPNKPWRKLPKRQRDAVLYGTGDRSLKVVWKGKTGSGSFDLKWEGVTHQLMRRFRSTESESRRQVYAKYLGDARCSACDGTRLRPESRAVTISGRSIVELSALTVSDAQQFFATLELTGASAAIAQEVKKEIASRLEFLLAVGLGYLSLDRAGPTLSGGESQRIRLASQVGSELTGVVYVLDEPSIGLHQRDNDRLLATLQRLRDIGNTVIVVEHDADTIRAADHVIDFGPGAGKDGGRVIAAGTPAEIANAPASLTGAYLNGSLRIEVPAQRRTNRASIRVEGASENNLRNIDVTIPLGTFTVVTGVSGAGKSTLVNDIVVPAAQRRLNGSEARVGRHDRLLGLEQLDKVIAVDQQPIGRTPRSNPATYLKVFDSIRSLFAALPESRARGYEPGRFSFNVKGGRCETCEGDGVRRVEMHFLSDVYVRCESCRGRRFNEATLSVRYRGKSVADVLELTVAEARDLFAAHSDIAGPLALLGEVGVDYLSLGQPSPTLSGGEAQRIKLARELSRRATGRTLYVLDEPTTGLHFDDVKKLLSVLESLVVAGNTVLVIEHNLDVIKCADHVIDLGPEGGPGGGQIVAVGTPEQIAKSPGSHTGKQLARLFRC
ncbi:MAG: excinuclease ABC subunit UvrA [Myxococcales bacterium]|nr:excinuclease ABC subunit UvrA [Myxococcales bacterium]